MERLLCTSDGEINLYYATEADRKLVYDLSFEDKEVILSMFDDPSEFHWDEIRDADPIFFDGKPGLSKYLLIEYNNEIIGVCIHDHHAAPTDNMELHIWLRSTKYTGRGIGTRVVNMLVEYLSKDYNTKVFMMRPWIKNPRAVKTYEKCGFVIDNNYDLHQYYTAEEIAKVGYGPYSEAETVNMLLVK